VSLVSVLTPTVPERESFFRRCSLSIEAQTYSPVEHVIERKTGIGPMPAFQCCLDKAQGEYVIAVGDDDWLAPHAIETLVPYLRNSEVVFGRTLIVSPGKDRLVSGHMAMWRKALTDEIGGYDPHYRHAGDSALFGRMIEHGASLSYCPEPLYFFTEHATHNSFLYREELKVELQEIQAVYADAHRKLANVVPA
jgi:hypothetical protein